MEGTAAMIKKKLGKRGKICFWVFISVFIGVAARCLLLSVYPFYNIRVNHIFIFRHMFHHMFVAEGKFERLAILVSPRSLNGMDTSVSSARPQKRRQRNRALREDDVETADTIIVQSVIHESEQGPVEKTDFQEDDSAQGRPTNRKMSNIIHTSITVQTMAQTHHYYLQQFVDSAHPMLKALLSCEALPSGSMCRQCAAGYAARWRCKDCTGATLMCRCCMQDSHAKSLTSCGEMDRQFF